MKRKWPTSGLSLNLSIISHASFVLSSILSSLFVAYHLKVEHSGHTWKNILQLVVQLRHNNDQPHQLPLSFSISNCMPHSWPASTVSFYNVLVQHNQMSRTRDRDLDCEPPPSPRGPGSASTSHGAAASGPPRTLSAADVVSPRKFF